jgi:hypothetical protein
MERKKVHFGMEHGCFVKYYTFMVIVKFISMIYNPCNLISAIKYDRNYSMLKNSIVNVCAGLPDGKVQWHATVLNFVVCQLHSQRTQTVEGVRLALKFTLKGC